MSKTSCVIKGTILSSPDLREYVEKFNSAMGPSSPAIFDKLRELSEELCQNVSRHFPIGKDGEISRLPAENLLWAANLILSAWLGWIYESKAIWHDDEPHPEMRARLHGEIIPSITDAFTQGIVKATSDKKREGRG